MRFVLCRSLSKSATVGTVIRLRLDRALFEWAFILEVNIGGTADKYLRPIIWDGVFCTFF